MKRYIVILSAIVIAGLIAGCGGGVEQAQPRRSVPGISEPSSMSESAGKATVNEITFQGWQAVELTNGLVTVVAVPEIGGRIMDYRIEGQTLLWVNPAEAGSKYTAAGDESQRRFHDFGGMRVFPAPVEDWDGPADPVGSSLTGGNWTHEILSRRGRKVEVELKSPADKAHTGLQITRTLRLYADTTHLQVVETFENVGDRTVNWAIQSAAQSPAGAATEGEEAAADSAKAYLPLNPDSAHKRRFVYFSESGLRQFEPIDDNALLEITYQGREGFIGADSMEGWVAYVNGPSNYALVQRFSPNKLENYPNEGSTVTVKTSKSPAYLQTELSSPIYEIVPGDSVQNTIDCYVTQVQGPVRDTTQTAAIVEPITVTKQEDTFKVTGKLGPFAPGRLLVYLKDKDGNLIGEQIKTDAMVGKMIELNAELKAEKLGTQVVVELENPQGSPLGEVFAMDVSAKLAKEEPGETEEKKTE
ncbi:MAG: hypothetical protein ACLFWB_02185 [Armatimonadota bacterium]